MDYFLLLIQGYNRTLFLCDSFCSLAVDIDVSLIVHLYIKVAIKCMKLIRAAGHAVPTSPCFNILYSITCVLTWYV